MEFLNQVEAVSALGSSFFAVVIGTALLALVLSRVHPAARVRLRVAVLFQLAGLAGLLLSAGLLMAGMDPHAFVFRLGRDAADVLLAMSVVTILGVIVFDYVLEPLRLRPPGILTDLILAAAYVAATVLVLGELDRDVSSVLTTSAIATAAIGFSLQDTLKSVMGGMSVQMDRTLRTGDWIRWEEFEGRVSEIRWRQTSIETREGDTVVIPNSHLVSSAFTILGKHGSGERKTRRWIPFEIDHGVSTQDVIHAVEASLRSNPVEGMALEPLPDCVLRDLRSAWQTFAVRYWLTDLAQDAVVDSSVRRRIIAALQRIGIGFSFPTQTLRLHAEDASHAERERERERDRRIRALSSVSIFSPLTDEEHATLAEGMVFTPFAAGETMTRQGATAHWLYVIVRGSAEVYVAGEGAGPSRRVASLEAGDFFGEMGLLTGEPRTATVVARTDAVCYRLDKDSFLETIQARPSVAEQISHLLAQRRLELDAVKEGLDDEARRQRLASAERDLLTRIRSFFRLRAAPDRG